MNGRLTMDKELRGYAILIGCGRLGAHLAGVLSDEGWNMMVIDRDRDAFQRLSPSYSGQTLSGDATEVAVLNEARIGRAKSVVVATGDDNASIFIAQIAKELFHVRHVIVELRDPARESLYRALGIDPICTFDLTTKEIERLLAVDPEKGEAV